MSQSITDRALAAKHTVVGSNLAKKVCKATTEEIMGPKRKHLDYLLQCTNEGNVSIPQMANLLIERTHNSSWVVVFKALVTVHNLMNYGNERFTQYLASSNCTFNLSNFYDRGSGMQGYGMSTFIRRYAKYMNQKAYSYRQMAFDFCRIKRGKDDGVLRTMNADQLIKALPILQAQFDALVEFDVAANQLTNGVINAAFMLLFKDLIRLYACYNDGIINLLGQYFDMNKKNCREAFEIYKAFLSRVDKVGGFFKVAESVGVDKGDMPDLAKAPSSLLEALEQHVNSLESSKKISAMPKPPAISDKTAATDVTVVASEPVASRGLSDADRRRIVEEEQRMLDSLKQSLVARCMPVDAPHVPAATTVAATTVIANANFPNIDEPNYASAQKPANALKPDFNPFNDMNPNFDLPPIPASFDLFGLEQRTAPSSISTNGFSFPSENNLFASRPPASPLLTASPASNTVDLLSQTSFSDFDDLRKPNVQLIPLAQTQPMFSFGSASPTAASSGRTTPLIGIASPSTTAKTAASPDKSNRLITDDLDKSLATIAGNLSIRQAENYKRADHQWTGPTEKRLTGAVSGNAWTQPPAPTATTSSMFPAPRPMAVAMVGMQPSVMTTTAHYPAMIPGYPVAMGQPMMVMHPATQMAPVMHNSAAFSSHPVSNPISQPQPLPPNDPFGEL